MNRTRWILFVVLAAVLIGGGYGVLAWLNNPMGQTLILQTPIQSSAQTAVQSISTQTSIGVENTPDANTAMPVATQTLPPTEANMVCGNTGSTRLLVIGLTTPTEDDLLAADAIRLVTIDYDQPSATIMTMPASLWVDTPVLADIGVEQIQLAMVYNRAYSAATGYPEKVRSQKATQAIAQTIVDNFGFVPDHYITVDEGAFVKYVNALGGIEINLPEAVDGTSEGYGIYPAGPQLLTGMRALNFSRLFRPGGANDLDVWGNLERQNMVVKGILAATLKPQNWTKIPSLMNEVQQAVITDLSLNQTLNLACMADLVGESARMLAVGEDMVTVDGLGRMIPDAEAIKRLMAVMDGSD
jgi:anionic cell wall polymer biosynthesis LytR-Cps2A-Psr (LCP) family protein